MQSSWYILLLSLFIPFNYLFAQDAPDSRMYKHYYGFWNGEKVILVKGRFTDQCGKELTDYFNFREKNDHYIIKNEDDLDSSDIKKRMFFFGPIKSYTTLDKYLPEAFGVSESGFKFQTVLFDDSLDAFSLASSDTLRFFELGNSMAAIKSFWTFSSDISQYLIMQNYAVTFHGYLNKDKFRAADNFDVVKLRREQLKNYSTAFYNFHYADEVFTDRNKDSLFKGEDEKLRRVVKILNLEKPEHKIECFVYKDIAQKYYLSATPGYGNPFVEAWQNHSIGLGPVEHESIHILCGNQWDRSTSTFWSEGIVGYYYYCIDSLIWKKDRLIVSNFNGTQIKDIILGHFPGFSETFYAISGHVVKFLIDSYGLEKFKKLVAYENASKGMVDTYSKSIDSVMAEWKIFAELNGIVLGPEKSITIKVLCPGLPDSSSVYITGSKNSLGNWDPGKIILDLQPDGSRSKTFKFGEGDLFYYKITRGTWGSERLDEKGNVPGDSSHEVRRDDTIVINVSKWKDGK